MVATDGSLLIHTPVAADREVSDKVVEVPIHVVSVPEMALTWADEVRHKEMHRHKNARVIICFMVGAVVLVNSNRFSFRFRFF